MKNLMQIVLTCRIPIQNKLKNIDIKQIILDNIKKFKDTSGSSSIENFLISKILNPEKDIKANSFVVIWKDNSKIPSQFKLHISEHDQLKKIKQEITKEYKIDNIGVQHIYPFASVYMYNMFIAGQNRLAIFIRPLEQQLAYKLGAYLINILRSNFKELDFKSKINYYKELEK